jgi:arylsulfatase A-like enzyme
MATRNTRHMLACSVLALVACGAAARPRAQKPNILLLLTDDQDIMIGGYPAHGEPMSQTRRLIQARGAIATQWRIHTPICGPSRAELQSGRYYHNIASKALTPPSCLGSGADSNGGLCLGSGAVGQVDLGNKVWPFLFPTALREAGYKTGLFGKCMNGDCGSNAFAGGKNLHTMGAFDRWFEHAGFVNGTFFDTGRPGCNNTAQMEAPLSADAERELWAADQFGGGNQANRCDNPSCCTPTFPGGVWSGRGDGYVRSRFCFQCLLVAPLSD